MDRQATIAVEVETLAEIGRDDDAERYLGYGLRDREVPGKSQDRAQEILRARTCMHTDEARQAMRKAYDEAMNEHLAAELEPEKSTPEAQKSLAEKFEQAWALYHPNPEALYLAARHYKSLGQGAWAQRLLDRALVEVERFTGNHRSRHVNMRGTIYEDDTPVLLPMNDPNGLGGVRAVEFSPDGRTLAVLGQRRASAFDIGSRAGYEVPGAIGIAWSQLGNTFLVTRGDNTGVHLIDLTDRAQPMSSGDSFGRVLALAVSPDGKSLATAANERTVRFWDLPTRRPQLAVVIPEDPTAMVFSPDGRILATTSVPRMTTRLWDTTTGREIGNFTGTLAAAFSPDGRTLATASTHFEVHLRDRATGQSLRTLGGHGGHVNAVTFSRDGKSLSTASCDGTARIWDVSSGKELRALRHGGWVTSVAFSPDGRRLASGSYEKGARIWDVARGRELWSLQDTLTPVSSLAVSPDGKRLAIGSAGSLPRVWDLMESTVHTFHVGGSPVPTVALSPDGKLLATGSEDGTAQTWDISTTQALRSFHHGPPAPAQASQAPAVRALAFSPDGRTLVTGTTDRRAHQWELINGKRIRTFEGHSAEVTSVVVSPDGNSILTGSRDRTVRLWDAHSGDGAKEIRVFKGHTGGVTSIAPFPDGKRFLTGSSDGTARLWDVTSDTSRKTFAPESRAPADTPMFLALTPRGDTFATGGWMCAPSLWSVIAGESQFPLPYWPEGDKPDGPLAFALGDKILAIAGGNTTHLADAGGTGTIATLVVDRDHDAGYVFAPDGSIDFVGKEAGSLKAYPAYRTWDNVVFPFEVFEERFTVPGLLAKLLSGEAIEP